MMAYRIGLLIFASGFMFTSMTIMTAISAGWDASHVIVELVGIILAITGGLLMRRDPTVRSSGLLGLFARKPLSFKTQLAQVLLVQPGAFGLVASLNLFSYQSRWSFTFLIISTAMMLAGFILAAIDQPSSTG